MLSHYTSCWKKSFVFSGKSTREEYWSFATINALVAGITIVGYYTKEELMLLWIVGFMYVFACLVPNLSASVRRVRDTGKSLWYLLLWALPYVGGYLVIGLLSLPSAKKK